MLLSVTEIFRSIQGETTSAGLPCTFVRLSGCNLECAYCDTRYAKQQGRRRSLADIIASVRSKAAAGELLCITGGEPLLQQESHSLMTVLADSGYEVLLETNGSLDISGVDPRVSRIMDIKAPGSGMERFNRTANLEELSSRDEIKVVISHREDFDWSLRLMEKHALQGRVPLVFTPAHKILDPALLASWILDSKLCIRLGLQLHKIVWPERDRGC